MVQPSQQHVAPRVKGVEWSLGTRGLRIVAAFWAAWDYADLLCTRMPGTYISPVTSPSVPFNYCDSVSKILHLSITFLKK